MAQHFTHPHASPHAKPWCPSSWHGHTITQQPHYRDVDALAGALETLSSYPPLVFAGEVDALKKELAEASEGKRFLLQGGDCAERFQDCNVQAITSKLKILLQMSIVLCHGAKKPVIRVGRIAGQYSKPRSAASEWIDGREIPVYRGDNINSFAPDPKAREPDPLRLLQGYHMSSLTLNYIRALTTGGFADLHNLDQWNLDFVARSGRGQQYRQIVDQIKNAVSFMDAMGHGQNPAPAVAFYTSHEGLLLSYEEAMTHYVASRGRYYNLGAHMLWIGERTRSLGAAHVEYFRGIANPLGVKVGPEARPSEIIELVQTLNPKNEPGKITLIGRFGASKVSDCLPPLIAAMQEAQLSVCWSSDPMHGNAIRTSHDMKTRDFASILAELTTSFRIHKDAGTPLGGVHFELTGEDVTECTGGPEGLSDLDLTRSYETYCDPRLNYTQSLEMAFLIASMLAP